MHSGGLYCYSSSLCAHTVSLLYSPTEADLYMFGLLLPEYFICAVGFVCLCVVCMHVKLQSGCVQAPNPSVGYFRLITSVNINVLFPIIHHIYIGVCMLPVVLL